MVNCPIPLYNKSCCFNDVNSLLDWQANYLNFTRCKSNIHRWKIQNMYYLTKFFLCKFIKAANICKSPKVLQFGPSTLYFVFLSNILIMSADFCFCMIVVILLLVYCEGGVLTLPKAFAEGLRRKCSGHMLYNGRDTLWGYKLPYFSLYLSMCSFVY